MPPGGCEFDVTNDMQARRLRKALGGGMRQAGVLAGAGLFALEHNVQRLAEDHENARVLAQGLANISGITIDANAVSTNIVFFDVWHPCSYAPENDISCCVG